MTGLLDIPLDDAVDVSLEEVLAKTLGAGSYSRKSGCFDLVCVFGEAELAVAIDRSPATAYQTGKRYGGRGHTPLREGHGTHPDGYDPTGACVMCSGGRIRPPI